jgi:hypothetical protein
MEYYIVTKSAVYHHGVFFVTDDKQKAINMCSLYAANDRDGYHVWRVEKYEQIPLDEADCDGDHEEIYSCQKTI